MDEIVINSEKTAKKLIFVFHGYGADKHNLAPIGREFARSISDAEIYIPNGIELCDGGFGYQWFPLRGDNIEEWKSEYLPNESLIISYIDQKVKEKEFDYKDVILTGFSQGAMISLGIGLKLGVKGIVSFAGLLLNPDIMLNHKHTKVLLAHGMMDEVVPINNAHIASDMLNNNGIVTKLVISPMLSHAIDGYLTKEAVDFLKSL